ncbi:MAG: glycoside hydrolase family 5 protein [Armatimonadota bacterium]
MLTALIATMMLKDARPVDTYGLLQAKGNRIVAKDGKPVALQGMSLFWSQWIGKYYTAGTVKWLKDDWKCSIVRAAIAADQGGYLKQPQVELAKAEAVIDAAVKEGIYVIVDWHDHKAEAHTAQSVEFFSKISKKYGKHMNVIYEIYNEPLKVSWKDTIKPYAETVIAAIRKNDPDNLIVVGTPNWSQDVEDVIPNPIKDRNVAYTLHFYARGHKQYLRDKAQKALNAGIPLVITEWGTVNYDGDGAVDDASTKEWLAFAKKNSLTMCNWSVADKVEGAAVLKPGASPTGNWPASQLTDSGKYVRELIRGWKAR